MSTNEIDVLLWQTKLETTFNVNGVVGGNLLPLIDMENNFSANTISKYYGHIVLLDSFQGFFLETLNSAYRIINQDDWRAEHPQYYLVLAYFTACFESFRAAGNIFHKGYATDAYLLLRSLKERAIYLCGVANNITTITKMVAYAGSDLRKAGADKKKKEIEAEEKRVLQKILRKQSGLPHHDIHELSKWEQLFNAETHGAKLSLSDVINGLQSGRPILCSRELTLTFYINRVSEIAWMFTRLLPYLQPTQNFFGENWRKKWQVLDESFLITEQSLSDMKKKIAEAFIVLINSKFIFNENFYYFEADGAGKKSSTRTFGHMKVQCNIPDNFNDESDEINDMFYGK